jgi:hypothetical protein
MALDNATVYVNNCCWRMVQSCRISKVRLDFEASKNFRRCLGHVSLDVSFVQWSVRKAQTEKQDELIANLDLEAPLHVLSRLVFQ